MIIYAEKIDTIQRDIEFIIQPIERRYLRFDDNRLADCFTSNFRFKQDQLHRLIICLRIPEFFELDNGCYVNGQEGLLVFLKLFSYPRRLIDNDTFLGFELSQLSRILKWITNHIYRNHRHRVQDYLSWHVPYLAISKDAYQRKKMKLHPHNLLNPYTENVCEAYDGFRIAVCRPQGSTEYDAAGLRIHLDIQAQVYSGHVKVYI
jgi:hypothetical protein